MIDPPRWSWPRPRAKISVRSRLYALWRRSACWCSPWASNPLHSKRNIMKSKGFFASLSGVCPAVCYSSRASAAPAKPPTVPQTVP